jgi:cell division protein FtsQ
VSPGRVSDATSRLKLRQVERKRGRLRRIFGWTLTLAVCGGLVYLFGFSPVLSAQKIAISGNRVLTKQAVLAAAGVPVGTPLATVDVTRVAEQVSGLPPVAEVTITRVWPTTLEISVTERKPRLAIAAGGGYLLADATGVVFQAVDSAPSGLVRVVASGTDRQLLADVGTVFSSLSSDTAAKVSRVEAPSRDGIQLRFDDGTTVVWGGADQSELKSQVLDDLLRLGGRVFDVSAPAFPTRR